MSLTQPDVYESYVMYVSSVSTVEYWNSSSIGRGNGARFRGKA